MDKGIIAENYFKSGYNCSQSVALAFADEVNMDKEMVAKLTIGFGGGMGRMREVCGAVSGMTFIISALYGNKPKGEVYETIQEVANKFKAETGSIVCRDLLGLSEKGADSPVPEARTKEYYKKRPCGKIVCLAANILEDFLKENKNN